MENIRYGRLDATDEEVKAAAKAVHADEIAEKLDKGYDSDVGEGGDRLRKAAYFLCTRSTGRSRHFRSGRSNLLYRHQNRAADPAGHRQTIERPHFLPNRPPPVHYPKRRPDPGSP